ncbi:MAG: phytanoyl-CoA dioxygenase family protein [Caldilineaceae bacterium]|nr:phytanoyl-CoA dioxygenase family protein [Caldilineaceae bacterium]
MIADISPAEMTAAQLTQFREEGYILIDNALDADTLARARAAYEKVQSATEQAWRDMVQSGVFKGGYGHGPDAHTMGNPYEHDTVFLDIADNPRMMPLVEEVIGPTVQTMEIVAHCHHAGTNAHTAWHRDWPPYRHPQYVLKAKVFYFLDDQDESMGCFSIVPGSHKRDEDPPRDDFRDEKLEQMPGMKKIVGTAGSAILWDVTLWHTGTANVSNRDRRILIYGYQPFWVKKWVNGLPPEVIVDWANTPRRRQLMGIHAVLGRASWDIKGVPYLPEHEEMVKAKRF